MLINGNWGSWTLDGPCSVTCGAGVQTKRRVCNDPAPTQDGKPCDGAETILEECNKEACAVNGNWGSWTLDEPCPVTCGAGVQIKRRVCNDPAPTQDGKPCDGAETRFEQCNKEACAVNGNWGSWTLDEPCPVTCGAGVQIKRRVCNDPAPTQDGKPCDGAETRFEQCNKEACAVNGNWGSWTLDGPCSVTCGAGVQIKRRVCNDPAPTQDGKPCDGAETRFEQCNKEACAVNGNWGSWTLDGPCSVTCGAGVQTKTRVCNDPAPSQNGKPCDGEETSSEECNKEACAVNGNWGSWGIYGSCSVTCGAGVQMKTRACNDPAPSQNGKPCDGANTSSKNCNMKACADCHHGQ
ncbi:hemicentin-1-like [Mytilus californianus]|uniref:hemicentin-1-like n=1 Tax=Mytilus californianus TaxID=6549 RepID=UPI002246A9CB|nr:hemicentin-1-like [Mytilus californianus]